MFDASQLTIASLPCVELGQRSELPRCPGVYFAVVPGDTVLYIGKARNIFGRWVGHHRLTDLKKVASVSIAWLELEDDHTLLSNAERACVQHFRPLLNGSNVSPNKSGKKAYTFKLSDVLVTRLEEIAETESRTLSSQLERFLRQSVESYVEESAWD